MLVRQLVAVQVLRDCLPDVEGVLIVDDDTFVPRTLLTGALQGKLDPALPRLMGKPVASSMFIQPSHQEKFPGLSHCGGGSGMLLTRGLLDSLERVGGLAA